jgi:hypothetical protein
MPLPGTLRAAWYVPGQLFSVNATTAASVPGLFARNERVVCVFEDGSLSYAMVLVGALFVGSMSTLWHGDVTPRRPRRRAALPAVTSAAPLSLPKSAEMGRFNMGSTVICLPPGRSEWLLDLTPGPASASADAGTAHMSPGGLAAERLARTIPERATSWRAREFLPRAGARGRHAAFGECAGK